MVTRWARDQQRRSLAPGTIRQRVYDLRSFETFLAPRSLLDATAADVEAWLDWKAATNRRTPGRLAPRTSYRLISNVHCFYEWAIRHELTDRDPTVRLVRPRLRRHLPRPIGDDDLVVAVQCARPVMRAWLMLAAFAGLRCAEIARLQREDVLEAEQLIRVLGKGEHERLVPLHPDVHAALRLSGWPRHGLLWVRADGSPWPPQRVSRSINDYLAGLGINATAHQLRHRFGTDVYRASRDLLVTQELLGHSSPTTTAVYTKFSRSAARDAVAALPSLMGRLQDALPFESQHTGTG